MAETQASGCWINIFHPTIGELVGLCGYDYALIDMEHSPGSWSSVLPMIRAVQLGGAKALVRVPENGPKWVERVMDMGADGILVPMVNTEAEAQDLANAALYAPEGTRGMAAGLLRSSGYGIDTDSYLNNYREQFKLIVQIETEQAVANTAAIAAVPGVDCIFIGPYDLSGSLGHMAQPEHATTRAAIASIVQAVQQSGKPLSTLTNPDRDAQTLFDEGYDLVFSGSDLTVLRQGLLADAQVTNGCIEGA